MHKKLVVLASFWSKTWSRRCVYVISIFMIFVSRFLTLLLVNLKTLKKKISYLTNLVINHERDGSFAMDVMIFVNGRHIL